MVYVGTVNQNVVGVIGYSIDRYETNSYWLGWFYVKNKLEQGYGTELLKHVEKELMKKGIKKLFVNTSSHDFYRKALNLYLDNGFRIEAVITDYYEKGEDQFILCKSI